jgi:hypothetical protein
MYYKESDALEVSTFKAIPYGIMTGIPPLQAN